MSARITIKSIANELGISFSTVSKALNHDQSISVQTRELVASKALEMGYQPNLMARGLRNKSTRSVAIILNDLNNPTNTYIIQSLSTFLLKYEYATIIFDSQVDLQTEKKNIQAALSRSPDCIIISPVSIEDDNLQQLSRIRDRVVYLDGPDSIAGKACSITIDHFEAGKLSAATMLNKGHRDILVLAGDNTYPSCYGFMQGVRQAFEDAGLELNENNLLHCASSFSAGHDAFIEYYLRNQPASHRISGVITFCDWSAFGVYYAASELGLSVPNDISLIGYDDNDFCLLANPPLSTIHYPKEEVIRLCCDMMISLISNDSLPGLHHTIHPHVIDRRSIRKM